MILFENFDELSGFFFLCENTDKKGSESMAYQQMQGFPAYQNAYIPPYQDRLAQLQNQYQQAIPQMQVQPQQTINQGLLWVQGEAGAKSYLVAPNTTVLLMDADAQRFYIKSTDPSGIPSLRTFEFTEVLPTHLQPVTQPVENLDDKYVTRKEFNEIMEKLSSIQNNSTTDRTKTVKKGMIADEQPSV